MIDWKDDSQIKQYQKEYRQLHKRTHRTYQRKWRQKNKKRNSEIQRRAQKKYQNSSKGKTYMKKWKEENKDKMREFHRIYRKKYYINSVKYLGYRNCDKCGRWGAFKERTTRHIKTGNIFRCLKVDHYTNIGKKKIWVNSCYLGRIN